MLSEPIKVCANVRLMCKQTRKTLFKSFHGSLISRISVIHGTRIVEIKTSFNQRFVVETFPSKGNP